MSEDKKTKDENSLLLEHEFDGIQELDNPPPPWLMYMLYISIFFAAIYWVHYHTFKQGPSQNEEYAIEMAEVEAAKANIATEAPEALALLTDETSLKEGGRMYQVGNCAACHGKLGEGNQIGPNLTDDYWINGGSFEDVVKVIKFGVLTKGMTPFKDQMNDKQIGQLTSYVLTSMKGSNPPNAKEAQGEQFVE